MSDNHRGPLAFRSPMGPGPLIVLDRLGRPIQPGQLIMYRQNVDMMFKVVDIGPVVHPGAPPGAMKIILHTDDFEHVTPAGMPINTIVIIGQTQRTD